MTTPTAELQSRITAVHQALEKQPLTSELLQDYLLRSLNALYDLTVVDSGLVQEAERENSRLLAKGIQLLGDLQRILRIDNPVEIRGWMRTYHREIIRELDNLITKIEAMPGGDSSNVLERVLNTRVGLHRTESFLQSIDDATSVQEAAQVAANNATASATKAKNAAASTGDAALATHFGKFSKKETLIADVFRLLTIASIVSAVVIATVIPHPPLDNISEIVLRFAQVLGIAGLGTYFARQSGQHRRVGNWANGINIQLLAFPAFIAPITDEETRNIVYRAFSERVLGSPPVNDKIPPESELDPNMLEVLRALASRP